MTELQNGLPHGWDCKLDKISGKYYYINHYTRTTTWDDPRPKTRHVGLHGIPTQLKKVPVEHIPLQHGSPELKRNYIYPSHSPPIQAFQMNSKTVPLQEMKSTTRSPLTLRNARVQDSSFTTTSSHSSTDTDDSVAKLSAMFPTVSETHIKLLLKKYLNREALVISALQVEKHPITTPGPFSTPPPQRNIHVAVKGPASRTGSPNLRGLAGTQGYRSSPRPHSSPKLKLSCRYMKSMFTNADEMLILECLQNCDNNIQKTTEKLKEMGYSKKETVASPKAEPKVAESGTERMERQRSPSPLPKMKTSEEKQRMKSKLQEQYNDVPEHLISIALESVNFDEARANQILKIMKQEDSETENNQKNKQTEETTTQGDAVPSTSQSTSQMPVSQSRQSIKSILKSEKKDEISGFSRILDPNNRNYKSSNLSNTLGHNSELSKGPNDKHLLENYIQWQGPQGVAKGPNKKLLSNKIYTPCGPNAEFRKGPKYGLAKGGLFTQLKTVVVGESRVQ